MVLFPLPVITAITLGIVGAVIESLSYLLIIGVVLLLAGLVLLGTPAQQKAPAPWLVRPSSEFLLVTPSPPGRTARGPVSAFTRRRRASFRVRRHWAVRPGRRAPGGRRRGGKAGTGWLRAG